MDNKVGDIVYAHFNPAKIGVVIAVTPGKWGGNDITVRWGTGKDAGSTETSVGWKLFETLVTDHERKAKKHRKTFNDIKAKIAAKQFP